MLKMSRVFARIQPHHTLRRNFSKSVSQFFRANGPSVIVTMRTPRSGCTKDMTTPVPPMRVALASTGMSKHNIECITNTRLSREEYTWKYPDLPNMAGEGVDTNHLLGDDALVSAYSPASEAKLVTAPEATSEYITEGWPTDVLQVEKRSIAALVGVADGVGGMGDVKGNQTSEMTHQLMKYTKEITEKNEHSSIALGPRAIMHQSWNKLVRESGLKVGATTMTLGLVTPTPLWQSNCTKQDCKICCKSKRLESEGNDDTEDYEPQYRFGNLLGFGDSPEMDVCPCDSLIFRFANVGDSAVWAVRPSFTASLPSTSNTQTACDRQSKENEPLPLAHSWPTYCHPDTPEAPGQMTILPASETRSSRRERENLSPDAVISLGSEPYSAQEGSAVLRRGDIIVAMSDGITDNFHAANLAPVLGRTFNQAVTALFSQVEQVHRFPFLPAAVKATVQPKEGTVEPATPEEECAVAGALAAAYAGMLVRTAQIQCRKVDDLSVSVGIVF